MITITISITDARVYPKLSQETTAMSCDIFINGKFAGRARNEGCGGCHHYAVYGNEMKILELATAAWVDKEIDEGRMDHLLPIYKSRESMRKNMEKMDHVIDELFDRKEKRKMARSRKLYLRHRGTEESYKDGEYHTVNLRAGQDRKAAIAELPAKWICYNTEWENLAQYISVEVEST